MDSDEIQRIARRDQLEVAYRDNLRRAFFSSDETADDLTTAAARAAAELGVPMEYVEAHFSTLIEFGDRVRSFYRLLNLRDAAISEGRKLPHEVVIDLVPAFKAKNEMIVRHWKIIGFDEPSPDEIAMWEAWAEEEVLRHGRPL